MPPPPPHKLLLFPPPPNPFSTPPSPAPINTNMNTLLTLLLALHPPLPHSKFYITSFHPNYKSNLNADDARSYGVLLSPLTFLDDASLMSLRGVCRDLYHCLPSLNKSPTRPNGLNVRFACILRRRIGAPKRMLIDKESEKPDVQPHVSPLIHPRVLLARTNTMRINWFLRKLRSTSSIAELSSFKTFYETAVQTYLSSSSSTINSTAFTEHLSSLLKTSHFLPPSYPPLFSTPSLDDPSLYKTLSSPPPPSPPPTLLLSYPRSGNTLLRTLLETVLLTPTGSDTSPHRNLSIQLSQPNANLPPPHNHKETDGDVKFSQIPHPLTYEGVLDPSYINILKSHYPERSGHSPLPSKTKNLPNKVVLLVRNPWDSLDSYWNMCMTNTHTNIVTDDVYALYKIKFEGLVKSEVSVWSGFNKFWEGECKTNGCGLLNVRYEDLVLYPKQTLERVVAFHLDCAVVDIPVFYKSRIEITCNNGISNAGGGSYKPQQQQSSSRGSASFGKSLKKGRYADNVIHDMLNSEGDEIRKYGYCPKTQDFPSNFQTGYDSDLAPVLSLQEFDLKGVRNSGVKSGSTGVNLNQGVELRSKGDPYGREISIWRKSLTDEDREPFDTVSR